MKESLIRKKALQLLQVAGWTTWYPKKVRYQETDVFGIWDILAAKGNKIRYIQITSYSNMSARKKKILNFLIWNKIKIPSEVWGLKPDKTFRIIKL